MALGVALGPRDFACAICGRQYTRVTCDFIVPTDTVCDECLAELGNLEERELAELLSQRKAGDESRVGTGAEER